MIAQDLQTLVDMIAEALKMLRAQVADPANGPLLVIVVVIVVVVIGLFAYF